MDNTLQVKWGYEDELECEEITEGMFKASVVDYVRMYPYVEINGNKYYLEG